MISVFKEVRIGGGESEEYMTADGENMEGRKNNDSVNVRLK